MRDSIQYALDNHAAALEYALQFARDLEPRLAENRDTIRPLIDYKYSIGGWVDAYDAALSRRAG